MLRDGLNSLADEGVLRIAPDRSCVHVLTSTLAPIAAASVSAGEDHAGLSPSGQRRPFVRDRDGESSTSSNSG